MTQYIVMPFRLAAKYQREWEKGYDPFADMKPREVIQCRREMVRREKQDAALEKWNSRDIDNRKD